MITDGDKDGADGSYVELSPGRQWVQIDLGQPREVWGIALWHFHKNTRAYIDVVVRISNDPEFDTGVHTLFNDDHDNSSGLGLGHDKNYIETNHGRIIDVPGTRARYLRLYSNGNSSNEMSHYVEVEIWGRDIQRAAAAPATELKNPWLKLQRLEAEVEAEWEKAKTAGTVDLDWLRCSHAEVLASMSLALDSGKAAPADFGIHRVMRIADRWWGIDAGATKACHMAAALMKKLGREDLRWAYLTTPVAIAHGSSDSWRYLESHGEAINDPLLKRAARLETTPPTQR